VFDAGLAGVWGIADEVGNLRVGRIERLPENKTAVLSCRCRFLPAAISRHNKRPTRGFWGAFLSQKFY